MPTKTELRQQVDDLKAALAEVEERAQQAEEAAADAEETEHLRERERLATERAETAEKEAEDARERSSEATTQAEEARDETDRALWELEELRQEIDIKVIKAKEAAHEEVHESHARELAVRDEMIALLKEKLLRLEASGGLEQSGHSRGTLNKGGSTVLVESTTSRPETQAREQNPRLRARA